MERKEDIGKGNSSPVYVRVQNLPWSACHKEVRQFFQSHHIPDGRISIYDDEAFIFFDSMGLLEETNLKDYCEINGNKVSLSVIKHREFRKRIHQRAKRTLTFGPLESLYTNKRAEDVRVPLAKRRKIRPTCMDDGVLLTEKENLANDLRFQPDEIDYPKVSLNFHKHFIPPRYRKPLKKRKIHPTLLPKSDNYIQNSIFCCEEMEFEEDPRKAKIKIKEFAQQIKL